MTFVLQLARAQLAQLYQIRDRENLKVAFNDGIVYVNGLTEADIRSAEVRCIPFATVYKLEDNLLFLPGHLTPTKRMLSGLLWTPIRRALPVEIPRVNEALFDFPETIPFRLVRADEEHAPVALCAPLSQLETYLAGAPAARLSKLRWVVCERNALVIGTPLLPLDAPAYYLQDDFLLPCGWVPEWAGSTLLAIDRLSPGRRHYVWFTDTAQYVLVEKKMFGPLTRSSFQMTVS